MPRSQRSSIRFDPLEPRLLLSHREYAVHGVRRSLEDRARAVRGVAVTRM